jgi:ABC-type multidrug transport system permease subunit
MLLNFMPCVFPVLAIKLLGITQLADKPKTMRLSAWTFSVGVLISFLLLGGLILLLSVFSYVGMGFFLGVRFARRSEEVVVSLSAIGVPILVLGGTFFPLEIMPQAMQSLAQLNPILHMNQAFKGVAAYGKNFVDLRFELIFLWGFCGLCLGLGIHAFQQLLETDKKA